jgi:hypothetical protein
MNKKFFADIKNIRTAIDTNKLVVFTGAGISIDAGVPGWDILIDEMRSEVEIPHNEQDYLRIAQMYFNDRQLKEFIDKVRAVLKHKKIKYNEIHEEIFQLNPVHILTTNFDDLLEQVIKKQSLPFSVVTKDNEFPYALNTSLLVKVHGDLDETNIVLKEDDYIDYSSNHPLIEAFLKSVFASKIVLFVGYSFSDNDLKMIIQNVRNILGQDFQNAYLLSIDDNLHPAQREYLKNKGINVVNYYDATNGTNYISEYLNGINALKEVYYKKGDKLTDKGQQLLDFLRFISSYDKFNEPLTEKNLIDQIYLSLNRFSEFTSLPPSFVANLFPFNNSKQYVHNYERYSLLTRNHKLHELFFNQIEYVNEEVKFKPADDMKLSAEVVLELESKLKSIIRTLNLSLIFYLFKENEKPDSFGNYGWSDTYKKLEVKLSSKCNCHICRLNRLELSSVITDVINSTIDETTSLQSDIELAYTNYKIGNFNQSYRLFEEVANKSWHAGKYFSYYIAKHNIKTLRNLIRIYERTLQEREMKKILKELEDIDFDKLLFQIPFMGVTEYQLLKSIRDDDILVSAEKEIENIYDKILNVYDGYKEGRSWVIGPFYPQAIEIELYKIISFYTNNHIVIDEFSDFTKVCKKGIEALIISFATNNNYKDKLKEFNKLFFDIVIFYCDAKEIKALTEKYEVNRLIFNEQSLVEILESVNNFLKSFFEENIFFGKTTHVDKTIESQLCNDFFKDRCRKKFDNIFLLLSGIELDKDLSKDLISNLLSFIKNENFLYGADIDYLCSFIYRNYILFSKDDFEELLQSIIPKLNAYISGPLIRSISYAFTKKNFSGISDFNLIKKILSLNNSSGDNKDTIIYLWSIGDETIKDELKEIIVKTLDNKFDTDLYTSASFKKIIDFNKYFELYISKINSTKEPGGYTLNAGRPRLQSFVFINAIMFIYNMEVKNDDMRLNGFTNLSEYMIFYLFPEKFNYKKFKVEWLYIGDRVLFYKRFYKIPAIKKAIEKSLKENFEKELAEIYTKYFIK